MSTSTKPIGTLRVPIISFRPGEISWTGPDSILRDELGRIPYIHDNGGSSFTIKLTDSKCDTIREFRAIVDTIIYYQHDEEQRILKLKFTYHEATDSTNLDTITVVEPVLAHIILQDDFIALLFEGDVDEIANLGKTRYTTFRHGSKIYHRHRVCKLCRRKSDLGLVGADPNYQSFIGVVIAHTSEITPEQSEMDNFENRIYNDLGKYYGFKAYNLL